MEFTQPPLLPPLESLTAWSPGLRCQVCQAPIRQPPPSKRSKGRGRYCSRACVGIAKRLPPSLTAEGATELRCARCKKMKPVDNFRRSTKASNSTRGRQYWCIPCADQARSESAPRITNPVTARRNKLLRAYGITMADYDALFEVQAGRCAICGIQKEAWHPGAGAAGRVKFLVVDHDHADDHVRGLLCVNCNNGLGHFRDNIETIRRAIAYIERDVAEQGS